MPDTQPDDLRALEGLDAALHRLEACTAGFERVVLPLLERGLRRRGDPDGEPPDAGP
ncbi:hypothetical protein [Deinococcus gobiensis]|uniref:hypothetical protein n=1 Tax=Deinococcus gobiensis TaxID=502394 RepID=UPI000307A9A2|nr:hypothetical protein [Deinococcus gobiensis]